MHSGFLEYCTIIIVLFIASNLWFYLRVLRPLKQLSLQAEQLKNGNFAAFDQRGSGVPEIQQLRRAMAGMVRHVRRSHEQSRAYAERLSEVQENERKHVAHELHDETLQSLIAINQSIELARSWIRTDPERAEQLLKSTREQMVTTATDLRNLIGGLRPPALEELGLAAALEMEAKKVQELDVHVTVIGTPRRLDEARELTLLRTAQEALTNVRRHSEAKHVDLTVAYEDDAVSLSVRDNGKGFKTPEHIGDLALRNHYGLIGIQERAQALGGILELISSPNGGTILSMIVPVKPRQHPTHLVTDPVCRATLEPKQIYDQTVYRGATYYFCCPVCQGAFQKDPELYLFDSGNTQ